MKDEMVQALITELELQSGYLQGQRIETLYFGGGTPSALSSQDISILVDQVHQHFETTDDAEITLEANPDHIHADNLKAWKKAGINRLSLGIQAFQDELLGAWNRSHSADQASKSLELIREAGFENITADLIYGGPGLTDEAWESNIQKLIDAGIPHISSYALTVETGTALHHQVAKGKVVAPDDDQANRQYAILQERLNAAGILQYEVSNFGKPGFESKHNMSYWSGAHYLGIGPSAHSFNTESRQWNVAHNARYLSALQAGNIPFEREVLTPAQRYNEFVMTGLRTMWGCEIARIEAFGEPFSGYFHREKTQFLQSGVLENTGTHIRLTRAGKLLADRIASDLFWAEPEP